MRKGEYVFRCGGIPQKIDKYICIQHQVEMALFLFFHDGMPIAIHTLASAAYWSLSDIYKIRTKREGTLSQMLRKKFTGDNAYREAMLAFKEPQNYFKHADLDFEEELLYDPKQPEILLIHCIWMFDMVFGYINHSMSCYGVWYMLNYFDEIQTDKHGVAVYEKYKQMEQSLSKLEFYVKVAGAFRGENNERQFRINHNFK